MFDLLAEEDNISSYILNYVKCKSRAVCSTLSYQQLTYEMFTLSADQQLYYKSALKEIEGLMSDMNSLISEFYDFFSSIFLLKVSYQILAENLINFADNKAVLCHQISIKFWYEH